MKARRMTWRAFSVAAGKATLPVPELSAFERSKSTDDREISTTDGAWQIRRCSFATRISGISSDRPHESRRSEWRGCSASSASEPAGQLYTPEDADQLMFWLRRSDGQILQEH
jgi:pyruvate dehydrogenase complex dehydrogenase (E1) component